MYVNLRLQLWYRQPLLYLIHPLAIIRSVYLYTYLRPADMYVESPSPTMVQATSVIPPSGRNQDQYRLVDPASVNSAIVQVNRLYHSFIFQS